MAEKYREYSKTIDLNDAKDTWVSYSCYEDGTINIKYWVKNDCIKTIDVISKNNLLSTKYLMNLSYNNPNNGYHTKETIEISKEAHEELINIQVTSKTLFQVLNTYFEKAGINVDDEYK